eukprot:4950748-Pleurochrysis_carterae.AAC.1
MTQHRLNRGTRGTARLEAEQSSTTELNCQTLTDWIRPAESWNPALVHAHSALCALWPDLLNDSAAHAKQP